MTERQRLLAEKLAANRQRWLRAAYLDALPVPVRTELELAPVLCEPDNAEIRRRCYVSPQGVGHDEPSVPVGYSFREFSWPEQVLAAAAEYPDRHDGEQAYVQPFQVRAFAGESMSDRLFGELPAFAVRFGWARRHLPVLFEATRHGLGLVSGSFGAGLVVSVVGGYLEVDPNPRELIYELGTWG